MDVNQRCLNSLDRAQKPSSLEIVPSADEGPIQQLTQRWFNSTIETDRITNIGHLACQRVLVGVQVAHRNL